MSDPNNTEEDVMDLLSVSDNFDMTREEESSLLQEDPMAVDSPLKTSAPNERKPIVFDLDPTADEDNESQDESRDKFKSERKTISFAQNLNKKREIPDTLDGFKRIRTNEPKFRRPKNKSKRRSRNGRQFGRQDFGFNRGPDLRQLIDSVKHQNQSHLPYNSEPNPFLSNSGLTPLMNYQLGLGILNPVVAQNQMLVKTLLAQSGVNPVLNRLSVCGQSLSAVNTMAMKPKEDFQITVANDNIMSTGSTNVRQNTIKTQTKPQIRCRVTHEDTSDSISGSDLIENGVPSMPAREQTSQRKQMSTLFAKHLANKVNQSKTQSKSNSTSSGGLFGDALAEAEVGVDNEYLRRMKEQEEKRLQIQRQKEKRRLEMADERLESALKLKQTIQRSY